MINTSTKILQSPAWTYSLITGLLAFPIVKDIENITFIFHMYIFMFMCVNYMIDCLEYIVISHTVHIFYSNCQLFRVLFPCLFSGLTKTRSEDSH